MLEKVTNNYKVLEKSIDAAWTRNEVISQNLANVDTPGYKKSTVSFEEYLNDALNGSDFKGFTADRRHIQIGGVDIDSAKITVNKDYNNLSTRIDGNNVDIESEMASMAENSLRFYTLIQGISAGYKRLIHVISEGRK